MRTLGICLMVGAIMVTAPVLARGGGGANGRRGLHLDPMKEQCAQQSGAYFDMMQKHYVGSPQQMAAWKRCMGR